MKTDYSTRLLFKFFRVEDDSMWIGHCLTLDVLSQGDTLKEAIDMTTEAASITIAMDLNDGFDPLDRLDRSASWPYKNVVSFYTENNFPLEFLDKDPDVQELYVSLVVEARAVRERLRLDGTIMKYEPIIHSEEGFFIR